MGERVILDLGGLNKGWGDWAASQRSPLGIQRKVVRGERVPGSFALLGPCLAMVTPDQVLGYLGGKTINTGSFVPFTKGQHFVDACLV